MILISGSSSRAAAQGGCGVGAEVRVEMIDNAVGRITEIGTKAPHVGWYRIVYDWNVRSGNPQGEWYNPKLRDIRVAASNAKCGTSSAGTTSLPPTRGGRDTSTNAPPVQTGGDESCPMIEPPGRVTKTSPASAAVFKRVIYEDMAAKVGGASISGPKKIGLTFLEFEMGRAYKNTLTANRIGDRRLHDGAPVGATIYPVKTKYVRCELYDREISRYVRQTNYACFKNSSGDWDCQVDSVTKTLERGTIPIK
jgi:hypothetical protein